jgi:hypothetical protein
VQVRDLPAQFTGDIFASDFLSVSSVVTYGTDQVVTWGPEHLLSESKVTFENGYVKDINLVFYDPANDRLLVISGPPTPNAVLVNTPKPPCVHWLGFDDLDFCGARVVIKLSEQKKGKKPNFEPLLQALRTPKPGKPTYPALGEVSIDGALKFNASGGLFFDNPYAYLNAHGPYLLIATLKWKVVHVDEPKPTTQRVWFTKVLIHHQATGQTAAGQPLDFTGDDDFWALGEPLSWTQMKAFTLENISEFCEELAGIGICELQGDVLLDGGTLTFGVFSNSPTSASLDGVGKNFLLDLSRLVGLEQFNSTFAGSLAHKAVTVPVLELP